MNPLPQPYQFLIDNTQSPTQLPADGRFGLAWHRWSDAERRALVHAWASGRPLLVRGEAGCGKSQLARALAAVLDVPLFDEVIHPRFEATDLLYREDPVRRLAEAQLLAATQTQAADKAQHAEQLQQLRDELHREKFTDPGVIWKAMKARAPARKRVEWPRAVILIDEIDKADSDVPNTLLDVMANRSFKLPWRAEPECGEADHAPLVVITTNEDRELPPAFLRRCAVLNMRPEDTDEATFVAWLQQRARAHDVLSVLDGDASSPMARAAAQVWDDREKAKDSGLPTVGLAEYLDLLYSLHRLSGGDPIRAHDLLNDIAPFALVKHREQDQSRSPVAGAVVDVIDGAD